MAMIKKLYFANGTDVTAPSDLSLESAVSHLEVFADDAAFVTANGAAESGDAYINSTTKVIKWYDGSAWRSAVDLSLSQTLLNKIVSSTGATTGALSMPSGTTAERPTGVDGMVRYNSENGAFEGFANSNWSGIGGAGAGGRNYFTLYFSGTYPVGSVTNGLTATGNRTSLQNTWGADNTAKLTIANNTTTPLRESGDFKITHVTTGAAFVESPMVQIDAADLGKAVTLNFDLTGNTLSGDFDVVVIRYNSSGTYQETISVAGTASLGTPASALLPTGTTKFNGFFIASSTQTDFYSVRIRRLSAVATTSVQIDSLFAGPQSIITGQKISTSQIRVDTGNGHGATNTRIRRFTNATTVGSAITFTDSSTLGSTFTINEAGLYSISYTDSRSGGVSNHGLSLNSANLTTNIESLSNTERLVSVTSAAASYAEASCTVRLAVGDIIRAHTDGAADVTTRAQFVIAQVESLAPNTTLAERAVEEYVFSTATNTGAGTSDTTSFGYGIQGVQFNAIASTTANSFTTYRVRCLTAITSSSRMDIEFSRDRIHWSPVGSDGSVGRSLSQGTLNYGMTFLRVSGSSTDVDILFANNGRIPTSSTFATNGAPWSDIAAGSFYWRFRKTDGGASVGYPIGARNIVGDTTGTAVPSGYVGEMFGTQRTGTGGSAYSVRSTTAPVGAALTNVNSITLNKGSYIVSAMSIGQSSSGSSSRAMGIYIGGTSVSNLVYDENRAVNSSGHLCIVIPIVISSDNTAVQQYVAQTVGTTAGNNHELTATRIA